MSDVLSEMLAGVETVGTSDAVDIEVDCVALGEVEALGGCESTSSVNPHLETTRQTITIEVSIILSARVILSVREGG